MTQLINCRIAGLQKDLEVEWTKREASITPGTE